MATTQAPGRRQDAQPEAWVAAVAGKHPCESQEREPDGEARHQPSRLAHRLDERARDEQTTDRQRVGMTASARRRAPPPIATARTSDAETASGRELGELEPVQIASEVARACRPISRSQAGVRPQGSAQEGRNVSDRRTVALAAREPVNRHHRGRRHRGGPATGDSPPRQAGRPAGP